MVLLKSSKDNGIAYVDTMNLDGETNLKEKNAPKKLQEIPEEEVVNFDGEMVCDSPNEFLDKWDGNISSPQLEKIINVTTKQLLLRGCKLKNTDYIYGFTVYTGN